LGAPWLLVLFWTGLGGITGIFLLRPGPEVARKAGTPTPANQARAVFAGTTGWDLDAAIGVICGGLVLGAVGAVFGAVVDPFRNEPVAYRVLAGAALGGAAGALAGHQAFHLSRPLIGSFGMLAGSAAGLGVGVLVSRVDQATGSLASGALSGLAGAGVACWVLWRPPDELEWMNVFSNVFRPVSHPPPQRRPGAPGGLSGPPRKDPAPPPRPS
jgi:hypothetical protein